MTGIIIPHDQLSPEALKGVIEDFVTRDGTDYGGSEVSLETKAMQVMNQFDAGKAVIVFDQKSQTCNVLPKDSPILTAMKKS